MSSPIRNNPIRKRAAFFTFGTAIALAFFAWFVARDLTGRIEKNTQSVVDHAIPVKDMGWLSAKVDGMKVLLSGNAPDQTARVRVSEAIAKKINITRIENKIIAPEIGIDAPEVRLEIVQNDKMSSIIGLAPREPSPAVLYRAMDRAKPLLTTLNLVEDTVAQPGEHWEAELNFLGEIVGLISNVKISASPGQVNVVAVAHTEEVASGLRKKITELTPEGVNLQLDITSPRALITPFSFSMQKDGGKVELRDCSVSNREDIVAIKTATKDLEKVNIDNCNIGLGAPTENWGALIAKIITDVGGFDRYQIDVIDNQIAIALSDQMSEQERKDVIKRLRTGLPAGFGVEGSVMLTKRTMADVAADGAEVKLSLKKTIDGSLTISGVVSNDASIENLKGFAVAKFGTEHVQLDLSVVNDLPANWEKNAFASLQVIAAMQNGEAIVTSDQIMVEGAAQSDGIRAGLAKLLNEETADAQVQQNIIVKATVEATQSELQTSPTQCIEKLNDLLKNSPIQFDKGSTKVSASSNANIAKIGQILFECKDHGFEISGHTDTKGGADMNLQISNDRAKSVLDAVLGLTLEFGALTSKGYGASEPIASNETEEGRAQNRRIEIRLLDEAGGQ